MTSKSSPDASAAEETANQQPKSFAPQARDPDKPNAWDSLQKLTAGGAAAKVDAEALLAMARSHIRVRSIRGRHFPDALFGEPGWDMLLALYVDARSERRHTVSSLGAASRAPSTTALRWMDYLEKAGLVARRANSTDKRVMFIELTDAGREAIEAYLTDLVANGLDAPARF